MACSSWLKQDGGVSDCAISVSERSYPDGSVVNCGGFYLLQNKYGGTPAAPFEDVDGGSPGMPSALPPGEGAFDNAELSAPTKTCYDAPIGATCP